MKDFFWIRTGVFIFLAIAVYAIFLGPPASYPVGAIITVPKGASIAKVASLLKQEHAVQSAQLFSLLVRLEGRPVPAGSYLLSGKESVLTLAYRFAYGKTGLSQVKVTFPEGVSVRQMGEVLKESLGEFDVELFISLAKPNEGYLFPDTYFFVPGVTPEEVVQAMKDDFQKRTAPLQKDITAFGRPESDVIVMASILEKEARQPETRRTVAGILWKRIALGMPLQVDAAFGYIFNKDTYSPSAQDLLVDSPYNTYKNRGLPPGPIGNPGVEAIEDAVTPIKTPYLYYVTDSSGNIYYARTYDEHLANIRKASRN